VYLFGKISMAKKFLKVFEIEEEEVIIIIIVILVVLSLSS